MGNTIATWNIQVISPNGDETTVLRTDAEKRVLANLPAMLEHMEENLEDLLPDGFQVRITEWNEPSGAIVHRDPEDDSGYYAGPLGATERSHDGS